ncbi:hypothetical protein V6N13_078378 [Hibiscus sabdariffa]|uniref:Uncharacterized protein n=2 Tax=Hibiscus sabdariffa TaxID=183260 RepID=A0ABR1Z5X5_9ROSI
MHELTPLCLISINHYFAFKEPYAHALKMKPSKQHKKQRLPHRGCKAWCCGSSCRLNVSSLEEAEGSGSDTFASVSSLAVHALVQEKLDQMINQRRDEKHGRQRSEGSKFVVMIAMEKCSYDPREDFRESMVEMITANRIQEPKDLRSLLNYYVSMNSEEYHGIILEVFHEHRLQPRRRKAWCWYWCCSCSFSCRLSVSSSEEAENSDSDRFSPVSSLAVHTMVQERLDQMINQRHRRQRSEGAKFVVMVAMEKCSYDPRKDFRESMMEMITANRIQEPKDLRNLLNYYVLMNSDEYQGIILEVFHEVCRNLFFIL